MSGRDTKNPLLSGAGINFPYENFTNSALLVPVPQIEPSIESVEIEADCFLSQECSSGSCSLHSLSVPAALVNKSSYATHSVSAKYSDSSLTSDCQHLSDPEVPVPKPSPIPVFTQSFTGALNPAKPTPVYADTLLQQFPETLNTLVPQSHVKNSLLQPAQLTKFPIHTVQQQDNHTSPLSSQVPSTSSATFTQNSTPVTLNASSCVQYTYNSICEFPSVPSQTFNYFSVSNLTRPNNLPSNSHQTKNVTSPPAVTPSLTLPVQHPQETNVLPGQQNLYRLSNIKRPTYSRQPELPLAPVATIPSPMTPIQTSAALFTPCTVDSLGTEVPIVSTSSSSSSSDSHKCFTQTLPSSQPLDLPSSFATLAQGTTYRPVYHHWFFKKTVEGKAIWQPFSMNDSLALDQAFTSATISPDTKIATDGGRYDVEVLRRRRKAAYWEEESGEVRRCSWFVKGSMDIRYVPYEENVATMLEEEYRIASTTNEWNRHVSLPDGEVIIMHSPNAIAHHTRSVSPDVWGNSPQMQKKPRVVKRGLDEFDISDGEPEKVDHLLFLVHGIGKFCDLKFRPVTEVVDDFRNISLQLLQSHFREAVEAGQVNRVEVLPVSWHQALHNQDIDSRLNNITLQSIPRLRHFTNDTLLDILFYTSPVFCETIVQAVGNEMNRLYNLFLQRNPSFQGGVSLGGHSLGSLILFDMLCNQVPVPLSSHEPNTTLTTSTTEGQEISPEEEVKTLGCMKTRKARLSRTVSYVTIGTAGTGQPFISYPQLVFSPKAFFALGSPIGMFVTVRGIEMLGEDFALPTCPMFFNIFHPFDPVAYRIESLINSDFSRYSPLLIPHHKGRKRMHLELKDTFEHVGTALKQRIMESFNNTWRTVYQLAMFHRTDDQAIEQEVNKTIMEEVNFSVETDGPRSQVIENDIIQSCPNGPTRSSTPNNPGPEVKMGQLNGGRRIDYVLQEAPLESFNEYLFALSSHVCYWESEDTMLMMLKEIYSTVGITPDSQVVHQILPFDVAEGGESSTSQFVPLPSLSTSMGMDPTAPISDNISIGPPPKAGFVRK